MPQATFHCSVTWYRHFCCFFLCCGISVQHHMTEECLPSHSYWYISCTLKGLERCKAARPLGSFDCWLECLAGGGGQSQNANTRQTNLWIRQEHGQEQGRQSIMLSRVEHFLPAASGYGQVIKTEGIRDLSISKGPLRATFWKKSSSSDRKHRDHSLAALENQTGI